MNMDRRALVAVVFCIVFYMGYTQYLSKKYPQMNQPKPEETQSPAPEGSTQTPATAPAATAAAPEGAPTDASIRPLSPKELRIETPNAVYDFDQELSAIKSIKLKKYRAHKDSPAHDWVELMDSPLVIQATRDVAQEFGQKGFQGVREGNTLTFSKQTGDWLMQQSFTTPEDGYAVYVKLEFKNTAATPQELTGGLWAQQNILLPEEKGSFFNPAASMVAGKLSFVAGVDGSREAVDAVSHCADDDEKAFSYQDEKIDFVGLDKHYFLSVIEPRIEKVNLSMGKTKAATNKVCPVITTLSEKFGMVNPGETVTMSFSGYFGPKDVEILATHDKALRQTVDFGWFAIIAHPLLVTIRTFYKYVGNWGVAIILLTVLLKILFYPLTKSAAVSMKRMQKLNPEMQRIRERFKDDQRRQQQELMAFMAKNKVNPAKGCLPILPQIPVFIAFYNVLSQSIELRHSEFFGWIQDLSVHDPYYISPILLGVLMFVQQKLTPTQTMDKTQERIMLMLPVIFTVMMLSLPAGMVLYMITNTIVSIGQQQWLNKKLDKVTVEAIA